MQMQLSSGDKVMPRKWIYAPIGIDYTVQMFYWISERVGSVANYFSDLGSRLLDKHCQCQKCQERNLHNNDVQRDG